MKILERQYNYLFSLIIVYFVFTSYSCVNEKSANKNTGKEDYRKKLKLVKLSELTEKPKPIDYIVLTKDQFGKIENRLIKSAINDTVSKIDYQNGILISESPIKPNEYWIYPPTNLFYHRPEVAAAVIKGYLYFYTYCLNEGKECPDPLVVPHIIDPCNPPGPPCFEGDDGPGLFKPSPTYYCSAIIRADDPAAECAYRKPCEESGFNCLPKFRVLKENVSYNLSGYQIGSFDKKAHLWFLYIWCSCECSNH